MTGMQDRERAFEAKFAFDEELRFKAVARRNRMAGLWAAPLLGKDDAEAYARELATVDLAHPGDAERKLRTDFDAAGVAQTDEQIHRKMAELLSEAMALIENG